MEKHKQIFKWNDTGYNFEFQNIIEVFKDKANLFSNKIAVKYGSQTITYKELDTYSDIFANYLAKDKKMESSLIGLCAYPSIEVIISILGILKSNNIYTPIDPKYPNERIQRIIVDNGINIIITQNQTTRLLSSHLQNVTTIALENELPIVFKKKYSATPPQVKNSSPAYVIHTSGSTDKPKGVLIPHIGLSNVIMSSVEAFGIDYNSIMLQFASLGFDASVLEIFLPLAAGGRLVKNCLE